MLCLLRSRVQRQRPPRALIFLKTWRPSLQASDAPENLTKNLPEPKLDLKEHAMKNPRLFILGLFFGLTLAVNTAQAAPDEYDDSQSNPLRIAAYLLHPLGWLTE